PWSEDTITNVWSSTKTVTSPAALMLVDRGELDVDAPVARYWPEFAAEGKQDVLAPPLLSPAPGVPGLDQPAVVEDLYDWPKSTSRMAAQAPWWEPGTASGYHALNYGHLVGEVGGIRLLRPDTIDLIFREQLHGVALVLGVPLRWRIGYGLPFLVPWQERVLPGGRPRTVLGRLVACRAPSGPSGLCAWWLPWVRPGGGSPGFGPGLRVGLGACLGDLALSDAAASAGAGRFPDARRRARRPSPRLPITNAAAWWPVSLGWCCCMGASQCCAPQREV